ncbi:MAG: TRAP transporter substrate-binding protein [Rhodospirillales bacterium]|nr:TRAP transporter substrate-binding protein [Rhodospirillales bacterium]
MSKKIGPCLISGFAAVLLASGLAATDVAAKDVYELKMATFTPEPAPDSKVLKQYAEEWEKKSNGRLKVKIFFGSAMGPMPKHHDLVRKGVADLAFFQHGVTPGRFPLTELIHLPYMVPAGVKGAEVGAMIMADLTKEYLANEHKGTKIIWLANTRPAYIYDANKAIRSVSDLKGRRYRAPTPTISAMLKSLGANPIGLPAPLMAESLQKGTIDGVITDPNGTFNFKLGGLVKHETQMFLAVLSFGLVMNQASYDKLPADLKKIIDGTVAGPERAARNAQTAWGDSPPFAAYLKKANYDKITLSAADDKEMRDLAEKFIEQTLQGLEKKGLPGRKVYAKMKALSAQYSK